MYGQVHANRVFYRQVPEPGHRFRQISLHELNTFIVIVGEGEVIQDVPQFQANNPDAEASIFHNLQAAMAEIENECHRAEQDGWIAYHFG